VLFVLLGYFSFRCFSMIEKCYGFVFFGFIRSDPSWVIVRCLDFVFVD